ncbi:hypothetical protein GGI25_006283 [Coemansia spiralis]|uniref:RING-type E3 ubiquitin transferase n=2 Tax=Coemansia TaxID=4863 RepID=A0A9W8G192_9FUNG|nr:hypothetical protein EDC05_006313 [Coemansia umbellata]KAJ2618797.1 hypothetical protein GGI26_006341 [Coemansia sp. RSA 1358]KAJ2669031.1 hypothetical protein GGI25_006283 [Coemansia spiralis]
MAAPSIKIPEQILTATTKSASTDSLTSSQSSHASYYSLDEYIPETSDTASHTITPAPAAVISSIRAPAIVVEASSGSSTEHATDADIKDGNSSKTEVSQDATPDEVVGDSGSSEAAKPMLHEENCAICLDDFEAGIEVRQLPCQHFFHIACIDPWLVERSGTCPLCNFDIGSVLDSEASDSEQH